MPTPTRASLPQTTFTDSEGQPLANGYLDIRLSKDAQVPVLNFQLTAGITTRIDLDANGTVTGTGTVLLYPNLSLLPADTFYRLQVFSAEGQLVSDDWITVTSGGSFGFGVAFGSSFAS
jgi:hypothetical protein